MCNSQLTNYVRGMYHTSCVAKTFRNFHKRHAPCPATKAMCVYEDNKLATLDRRDGIRRRRHPAVRKCVA